MSKDILSIQNPCKSKSYAKNSEEYTIHHCNKELHIPILFGLWQF